MDIEFIIIGSDEAGPICFWSKHDIEESEIKTEEDG